MKLAIFRFYGADNLDIGRRKIIVIKFVYADPFAWLSFSAMSLTIKVTDHMHIKSYAFIAIVMLYSDKFAWTMNSQSYFF